MSFYRKYRPQVFEEIDNVAVRERILSLLNKEKSELPHAFLFTGPKGAGKTTTARLIAKLFNCEKPTKTGAPCGMCDTCKEIADGRYMDVLELDAASNRGIDEIRTLREGVGLSPSSGAYKIYIIDEVHMLTSEAFNALLKTLEEPPPHAVFILATTDPQKVPATIKSRCVIINFGRATDEELLHALTRAAKEEKMHVDKEILLFIASLADGAFRDAMKLLEQVSFDKGTLTKEKVQKLLAASEEKTIATFFDALTDKNAKSGLEVVAQLVVTGRDIRSFISECLTECERRLVASVMGKEEISTGQLQELIRKLTQAYADLRISPVPQLPLELAVVEFCGNPPPQVPVTVSTGMLTFEKLSECWKDVIEALKPLNHSVAGVMRSTRPTAVVDGIVTIEAFYKFHQEKLSEPKTKEMLGTVFNKLFGEKVKVDVVLGKK